MLSCDTFFHFQCWAENWDIRKKISKHKETKKTAIKIKITVKTKNKIQNSVKNAKIKKSPLKNLFF
jgi:hypothetical protein